MDSESLRTASTYLNNLLLARGLLRNSEPIDFVKPSRESRAQIINLVHDLVLRSDRDKDQRENISFSLRQLRADDTRKNAEIDRLKEKSEENARGTVQAQAAERTAKDELKKVERSLKSLQDQSARLKTTLAQVKTQCANDVRKRDLELARLKTHLQGQQRGNKAAGAAPSITIAGGARRKQAFDASVRDLRDPEYSLKQETTEFLTQLSQGLSDENDGLLSLLRDAVGTMKDLLGLPANALPVDSAIGSRGSGDGVVDSKDNMLNALPTSYEALASDLENTMTHLKRILTNPNFVTVEEVEMREEEIMRLRQGWEHMEKRWKELLLVMQGWQERMHTGETINLNDLQRGMVFLSPEREERQHAGAEQDQSFAEGDVSDIRLPDDSGIDESSVIPEPPRMSGSLTDLNNSKRKRDLLEPPATFDLRPPGTSQTSPAKHTTVPFLEPELDYEEQEDLAELEAELDEPSEHPSEPRMTVHEKLNAVAQEAASAQAAREARARERAAAKSPAVGPPPTSTRSSRSKHVVEPRSTRSSRKTYALGQTDGAGEVDELQDDDTLGQIFSPVKKTKIRGRAKRRKSTLSPEELAAMLVADDE